MSRRPPLGIDDSDPWADFRDERDRALASITGDGIAAQYERNVIWMMWEDVTDEPRPWWA